MLGEDDRSITGCHLMNDYLFKCYCKNKHLESERVRKPGKRYGLNYHVLVPT
ncbi:hypothetical protein F960_02879 [Acinetobacter gerneri DSM 14967 = CIP 107464 = MTCC 9824]|uniref:Uncharacterized protein n=1 Tax=Acinetobacter gerneri DSM 14967 = CIP 107464 = MTCC 9824 TaxID=1120926 RepID=N8Y8S3_9GAMM|nr:hypothetical protein F960_02879 [Acinetobacter gerneri DSM 14967 = CIP 107464 = MTCC 9824]